ncbi:MAG: RNA-binding protein [Methylocella sp.]
MIDIASGEVEDRLPTPEEEGKNPAAVERGHLGGIQGGKARAHALSKENRREISRRAATARWSKVKEPSS